MKIDVFSHYVKVTEFKPHEEEILFKLIETLVQWDVQFTHRGVVRSMKCVFAVSPEDRSEYRFHKGNYEDLMTLLRSEGVDMTKVEIVEHPIPEVPEVEYKIKEGWVPREGQRLALEYMFQDPPPHVAMIPLQAGAGKTATTFFALAKARVRGLLFIKSSLMEQWAAAFDDIFESRTEDVILVSGRDALLGLHEMATTGQLEAKLIIISLTTFQDYITDWEANSGPDGATVPVNPEQFITDLQAGMVISDEWHLFFHLNFKIDLFLNAHRVVKLSATVDPDDRFIERMYAIVSPPETRFEGIPYNKYVYVNALEYTINQPHRIRTNARGRRSYSHGEFEKSLKRNKLMYFNYLNMIEDIIRNNFIEWRKRKPTRKGARMIVYAALQDTCTDIRDHLRNAFPGVSIDRVISSEYKANKEKYLAESEILVSTIGSIGVGNDISDLMYILLTHAISSRASNEQSKGRLREPKEGTYEGDKPVFEYLYASNIPKHVEYHRKKLQDFKGKCISHADIQTNYRI